MYLRRNTKEIYLNGLGLGGKHPLRIQSMNNTDTRDIKSTLEQVNRLAEAGCEISRLAVLDMEAADAFKEICKKSPIPLVADIHFDYRLAIAAIENGAAKVRINPGNIGSDDRLKAVVEKAREYKIPMRIGVNAGSLEPQLLAKYGKPTAKALVESALLAVMRVENLDFNDLAISIKSSSPMMTIEAYRLLADKTDYPLHIGVTEAGTVREGIIRSAVGIGTLLAEGIGDTLRVSLTADPVEEVKAAWSILKSLDLRAKGPTFVSCPTCGRTQVELEQVALAVEKRLENFPHPCKIAVMGCAVNGPGEAKDADYGIAGGKGKYILFAKGQVVRQVPEEDALQALLDLIKQDFGDWEER